MSLQAIIEKAWDARTAAPSDEARDAVSHVLDELDTGRLRVAEKQNGTWITHEWLKKAVLLPPIPHGGIGRRTFALV